MVPFDAIALLAMLQAFYPVVGPAALAQARRERPDYFAAAVIIGTSGDKIQLADGRIFDLIFDALGPNTRWQAIEIGTGPGGPDVDDPFALEAGPLVPIDLSAFPSPASVPVFESLVAGRLWELGVHDAALQSAQDLMLLHSSSTPLEDAYARTMDHANGQLGALLGVLYLTDPVNLIAQSRAAVDTIDAEHGRVDEPPPADPPPLPPLPPPIDIPRGPNQPPDDPDHP